MHFAFDWMQGFDDILKLVIAYLLALLACIKTARHSRRYQLQYFQV